MNSARPPAYRPIWSGRKKESRPRHFIVGMPIRQLNVAMFYVLLMHNWYYDYVIGQRAAVERWGLQRLAVLEFFKVGSNCYRSPIFLNVCDTLWINKRKSK